MRRNKYDMFNGEDEKPHVPAPKQQLTPTTNLEFDFEDEDELQLFDIDMDLKTNEHKKHITIINHTHKKKNVDVSTKLF